jgi:hypothetical protein
MSSVAERESISVLASEVVEHLHGVRKRLAEEIRDYPTPIPRCDAQFNHLYEQQGRLLRDLDRLEATRESIERFVASAPYTDDPSERDFRARVKAAIR